MPDSAIYRPESWVDPLPLGRMFPCPQPLEVELGAGDGSFLARWADSHRDRNFLGIERLLGRLRKLDRKGQRLGLTNLRLMRVEASYFLNYLLPAGSVDTLHVYFPDSWPKRKHRKNRLINPDFVNATDRVLQKLWSNRDYLIKALYVIGYDNIVSETPIIPIKTSSIQEAVRVSKYLFDRGVYAPAIRPPTVEEPRIRIVVTAAHEEKHLARLVLLLKQSKKR